MVQQTDLTAGSGNALQACVASLFGLELDQVPNFVTLECGYEEGIRQFVAPSFVVRKIAISEGRPTEEVPADTLVILRGKSPRGAHGHVVIAKFEAGGSFTNELDPHPDSTFLDTAESLGWCIMFEPNLR